MKVYVKRNENSLQVLHDVVSGEIINITVSVSNRPYMCFDIWGNYIKTLDYIKDCGCEEYIFPPKDKKERKE